MIRVLFFAGFLMLLFSFVNSKGISHKKAGPMDDAVIVNGSVYCNKPWLSKNIKNNSDSKRLTVTIEQTDSRQSGTFRKTIVIDNLAPKEERELGCSGCGETTTGQQCTSFRILAAVYP